MRKPRISALLVITVVFAAFTMGFFMGRNYNKTGISVSVSNEFVTAPTISFAETVSIEEVLEISFPISINQAEKEAFMALPGIGEVLAARIIAYRDENGSFSSLEELLNVEGIGKKRLEEIMDLITIGG